jgi:hypothetical protein
MKIKAPLPEGIEDTPEIRAKMEAALVRVTSEDKDDSDETEGRALYRARADTLARSQIADRDGEATCEDGSITKCYFGNIGTSAIEVGR